MNRRDFIKSSGTVVAALSVQPDSLLGLAAPPTPAGRMVLPMNRNWRFSAQRVENDTARAFDDSRFERVIIPHTNRRLPWHSFDDKSYEFVSVYRRHFPAAADPRPPRADRLRRRHDRLHRLDQRPSPRRIQGRLHAVLL